MSTQSVRKFCPVCKLDNEAKATICRHCGTPLYNDATAALTTRRVEDQFELTEEIREQVIKSHPVPSVGLSLFLLSKSEPIALCMEQEFVLGRDVDLTAQTIVDLTEFEAFGLGVSRRHAMIKVVEGKYVLTDLYSSNGTWINGERLLANKSYDLPSGAVIQLGRMKLVVNYTEPPQKTKSSTS